MIYGVKCTPIKNGSYNVVGLASIVLDNKIMVSNIQLVQNDNNYEVHYPSRKSNKTNTGYMTIAYPADAKLKKKLMSAIISSFKKGGEKVEFENETPFQLSTKVKVFERDSIRGLCRVSLSENDEFRLNDIMLRDSSKGVFVDFPSYKSNKVDEEGNPVYNSVINPFTKEFYAELKDALLSQYDEELSEDEPDFDFDEESKDMPELLFK